MMCKVLEISPSAYYKWKKYENADKRSSKDFDVVQKIKEIHFISRRIYGSPRIYRVLKDQGFCIGKHKVASLMRKNNIRSKSKRKFKRSKKSPAKFPSASNILNRQFKINEANRVWMSDISYIWTKEGWSYLAVIMDLYSRKIIAWALEKKQTTELIKKVFYQAIKTRKPKVGTIFHTDRGAQFANHEFQGILKEHGFIPSMNGRGTCYDNAVIESFFHTLKMEHVYWNYFETNQQAKTSIFEYIEIFYNGWRRHSSLNYKSPIEYENENMIA